MSETEGEETPQTARRVPEEGRKVWAQEYPGGDMQIEVGHIDNVDELYLMSEEAEALRQVLNDLEDRKDGDDSE